MAPSTSRKPMKFAKGDLVFYKDVLNGWVEAKVLYDVHIDVESKEEFYTIAPTFPACGFWEVDVFLRGNRDLLRAHNIQEAKNLFDKFSMVGPFKEASRITNSVKKNVVQRRHEFWEALTEVAKQMKTEKVERKEKEKEENKEKKGEQRNEKDKDKKGEKKAVKREADEEENAEKQKTVMKRDDKKEERKKTEKKEEKIVKKEAEEEDNAEKQKAVVKKDQEKQEKRKKEVKVKEEILEEVGKKNDQKERGNKETEKGTEKKKDQKEKEVKVKKEAPEEETEEEPKPKKRKTVPETHKKENILAESMRRFDIELRKVGENLEAIRVEVARIRSTILPK